MKMVKVQNILELFRTNIYNRYQVYNSLFLNTTDNSKMATGVYIPLLHKLCVEGFRNSKNPVEIIDNFISTHKGIKDISEKFSLLFQIIKYIERQVVLFDCIEDAAFDGFKRDRLSAYLRHKILTGSISELPLNKLNIRLVFTAHPTQFYSDKVQTIMGKLRNAVRSDDITEIDILLQQLAFTPFVNNKKPTPEDEAANIIYYLRYVYYDSLGYLFQEICNETGLPIGFNPNLLEMGFWPGGDRDGNPFVTADTTMKVADLLRNNLMKCYYNQVKLLQDKLTFKDTIEPMEMLKNRLYAQIFSSEKLISHNEILEILSDIREIVKEKYNSMYLEDIENLIGKLYLFGDHFATLDVRQDSSIHRELIAEIFYHEKGRNFIEYNVEEQIKWLTTDSGVLNGTKFLEGIFADTIINIRQMNIIQMKNGERGLHRYIISNTESIQDILSIYKLFLKCGYKNGRIPIDIVPLFETMQGMNASVTIMRQLYNNETYKQHLKSRNNKQTIMLGFSDGTKDGGYLKANWEIYQAKIGLTQLASEFGIEVIFFDGRGGPPARGGGKTHQFYASQGPEIAGNHIHLTIQGQTITSIYGTREHSIYNLEQLLMAAIPEKKAMNNLTELQKDLMQKLADKSFEKYASLKNHPMFVPYLEKLTTLRFYGETNIASRPTKRNTGQGITLKDLRAIPFVGAWSLAKQNVPGYYGLGSALEHFKPQKAELVKLYRDCAFFRTLINNSMMSLKKCFFPLTEYLEDNIVFGDFILDLKAEFELTKKWLLLLSGQVDLMENETYSKASVEMRDQIVLPLLTIQQYALQMLSLGQEKDKDLYEKLVIRSMFGNINASRNSA